MNTKTKNESKQILMDDLTFKNVFCDKEIAEYVIKIFFEYLKEHKESKITNITSQKYIPDVNKNFKAYFGDIVADLQNGDKVNLESYNDFGKVGYNKSFSYMNRIYSRQLKVKQKEYQNLKHVYSINFIRENYRQISDELVNVIEFRNKKHNKKYDDGNETMYLVRVDLVSKIPYTKDEERFITLLRMLNATSMEEMAKYGEGDEDMSKIIERAEEWEEELDDGGFKEYMADERKKAATEAAKIAKADGIKTGKSEAKLEYAQSMKKEGIAAELIHKITGLSISKIMML